MAEERERGQLFALDVELEFAFPACDSLGETVDYVQVIEEIRGLSGRRTFQLLESFAQVVAEELLASFERLQRVCVRVRKLRPPLPAGVFMDSVCAQVIKERDGVSG